MERKSTIYVTGPKHLMHQENVRGSQCHHSNVSHQRWDYNICGHSQAKYDLVAEVASHEKPEAPASACLRRP